MLPPLSLKLNVGSMDWKNIETARLFGTLAEVGLVTGVFLQRHFKLFEMLIAWDIYTSGKN